MLWALGVTLVKTPLVCEIMEFNLCEKILDRNIRGRLDAMY